MKVFRAHGATGQEASHCLRKLTKGRLPAPSELTALSFVVHDLMLKSPYGRRQEIDLFYTHCWFPDCEVRKTEGGHLRNEYKSEFGGGWY